ncbi:MAG: serine/threonine-protein kinase [Acidobacteriia bacterium]|nr:serine/threonine-protein kinase [Terriglobia bacterium]
MNPEDRGADDSLTAVPEDSTATQFGAGTHLGPYRIESPLGAGGMGQVFRARDTRLGRAVAIKVSNAKFSDRFEREARAISALNHPHICTLYDVGPNYLVMELIEGEALSARLRKGRLAIEDVLRYGGQIADALAAAHSKNITHRDLKPANIMVTKTGVKVLDFGLAKIEAPGESLTQTNAVMGTPAYMAPEQLEGKVADARTDVFSLGLVLYEMATGKRVVAGQSASMDGLPIHFAHIAARCLEQDPEDRWQSARDLKAELDWTAKSHLVPSPRVSRRWNWSIGAASVVAVVLALSWVVIRDRTPGSDRRVVRLQVAPSAGTQIRPDGAAISPDGNVLAFVANSSTGDKLFVRMLNSLETRELPGTDGAAMPFWSPDSKSLGFFASGKLKRIDLASGLPTAICDVASGRGGTWNQEGIILFNGVNDGPLLRVPASGGTPEPLTVLDGTKRENSHRWPEFLPDGRHYIFFVRTGDSANEGLYLGSMDRPQEKIRLIAANTGGAYAPGHDNQSGYLLWSRAGTLMAQPLDVAGSRLTGEAVTVAESVAGDRPGRAAVSASTDGTLVYAATAGRPQLTWFSRDGKELGTVGQPDSYVSPRISPDGKRVAVRHTDPSGSWAIWLIDFGRGIPIALGLGDSPVWSPNGEQIAHLGPGTSSPNLWVRSANGAGQAERLTQSSGSQNPEDWSSDGRYLLYKEQSNDLTSATPYDLWILPMTGDRKPFPFQETPFTETEARFSPEGRWISYSSDESGRNEVYVQSFPAGGAKSRVSVKGGDQARWRRDGKELFYLAPDRSMMSVAVRPGANSLEFGSPNPLFRIPGGAGFAYDVAPDGQRFLVLAGAREAEMISMTVVMNWQADLRK